MSLPLLGVASTFLGRLRHPTLFKLMAGLMLVSWLWPFDPIPFIDEIITLTATLWLSQLKKPDPAKPPKSPSAD